MTQKSTSSRHYKILSCVTWRRPRNLATANSFAIRSKGHNLEPRIVREAKHVFYTFFPPVRLNVFPVSPCRYDRSFSEKRVTNVTSSVSRLVIETKWEYHRCDYGWCPLFGCGHVYDIWQNWVVRSRLTKIDVSCSVRWYGNQFKLNHIPRRWCNDDQVVIFYLFCCSNLLRSAFHWHKLVSFNAGRKMGEFHFGTSMLIVQTTIKFYAKTFDYRYGRTSN